MGLRKINKAHIAILRKVTDGATEILRGLGAAGQSNRDCWIIHLVLANTDAKTRRKCLREFVNKMIQRWKIFSDSLINDVKSSTLANVKLSRKKGLHKCGFKMRKDQTPYAGYY
ncbi:hypothetical protein ACLKA7_005571 [Drosophila subpalustris]